MKRLDILEKIMGAELLESLNKALVKLNTKSVVDLEELHSAIKTVPKSIIAFLMRELKDMKQEETKEITLPWAENAMMTITKMGDDVFRGDIVRDSKIIHEFDLTAIPQLAAHLMSTFELYDGMGEGAEPELEESSSSSSDAELWNHVRALDGKINALMMMVANQNPMSKTEPPPPPMPTPAQGQAIQQGLSGGLPNKTGLDNVKQEFGSLFGKSESKLENVDLDHLDDETFGSVHNEAKKRAIQRHGNGYTNAHMGRALKEVATERGHLPKPTSMAKSQVNKFEKFCKSLGNLKKAGLMPTMPHPPKPGTKVGGNNGITKEGFHGPKTSASDTNTHPYTQLKDPDMKVPKHTADKVKQPKQPKVFTNTASAEKAEKSLTFKKSELEGVCSDCGGPAKSCACFQALSKPEIKKTENDRVTLRFKNDWDAEALSALMSSLKKSRRD